MKNDEFDDFHQNSSPDLFEGDWAVVYG